MLKQLDKRTKILFIMLFISIGVAIYNLNNVSYEAYCQEAQAQCHLNNKASVTDLFYNIKKAIFD